MKIRKLCATHILLILVALCFAIWSHGKISQKATRKNLEKSDLHRKLTLKKQSSNKINFKYKEALSSCASDDGIIILAMVDEAFVDMALNLYLTSFLPHGIENFLFLGAGARACDLLLGQESSLPCLTYAVDKDAGEASQFPSAAFLRKMNIRTHMIPDALAMGLTVVHLDVDMYFSKNPLPHLSAIQGDILILWDVSSFNAGFLMVRPTDFGKEIYKRMDEITKENETVDDHCS